MLKRNVKLYQACIATGCRLYTIAGKADIKTYRLSKILNGKLQPTTEEKRKLSKILKVAQKNLF